MALTTAALWGSTAVAVKFAEDAVPPIAVAAIRFALAALFMIAWWPVARSPLTVSLKQFPWTLLAGAMLFVQITLFNWAIHLSNASYSVVLISTFVFWVALIEHFVTRNERLNARKVLGVAISGVGVVIILTCMPDLPDKSKLEFDAPTVQGNLLMLASAFVLAIKTVYTKHAVRTIHPNAFIFWHHTTGTAFFVVASLLIEPVQSISANDFSMPVVLGLLYQGIVVGGICFAVQAGLLKRHGATQISVFAFATPLFGVSSAAWIRGDQITLPFILSGLVIAFGIYLVNRR